MKLIAGGAAALLASPLLVVIAFLGGLGAADAPPAQASPPGIPAPFATLYPEAAARFGIPSALLAAVGKVECDHGRDPRCATPNEAGAEGPMQFVPATFTRWSWASGSPAPSPYDQRDAVFAAAAKLAGDGAAVDPIRALRSYNPSDQYAASVIAWAVAYGWVPAGGDVLGWAVLRHPRIALRPEARGDVEAGIVDRRVLGVVLVAATAHRLTQVGPFVTGHSTYVAGTDRVSNHARGRAADLPVVDGVPVSLANGAARDLVSVVLAAPEWLRPDEVGCPWPLSVAGVQSFTEGHSDHIHLAAAGTP